MIHAASTEERERLLADFVRYCEIESPSGQERGMADALTEDLRGLGLEVEEDEAGNLLARIAGPEAAPPSSSAPTWTPFRSTARWRW